MSRQRTIATKTASVSMALALGLFATDIAAGDEVRNAEPEREAAAEEQPTPTSSTPNGGARPDPSSQDASSVESAPPLYVLPRVGKPRNRVGGGRRGAGAELPEIYALVPEHVGQTTSEQPVLYWYLSGTAPETVRFELTLNDEESIDPVVDTTILSPVRPGLQRFSLADHGVSLKPGEEYHWSVSIVSDEDNRSEDLVSSGWVERVTVPVELGSSTGSRGNGDRVRAYGQAGLWYDALDAAYEDMMARPDDPAARARFERLLADASLPVSAAAWADH
ncbi:MAG: DUF928 domain-containing protein [Deltaproteobacteria bacterium]|nr:DUF928 domain-containing protein [Deltaproteobacteria bacterium]